MFSIKKKM